MIDNNELFNFFDEWKDEPKTKERGTYVTSLPEANWSLFDDFDTNAHSHQIRALNNISAHDHRLVAPDLSVGMAADSVITFDGVNNLSAVAADCHLAILPLLMIDMAKKNDDTSLLFMKPSKEFDDSMIRMEMLKIRAPYSGNFMFNKPLRDTMIGKPSYPTEDHSESVPETPAHLLWYNSKKKRMNNITSMQAISAPDHFSDLDRKLQEMQITKNYEEALLSTKVTMTFDDAIIAGLVSIYKTFKDDEKNFEYAMELAK